jgi:hypothetical protein
LNIGATGVLTLAANGTVNILNASGNNAVILNWNGISIQSGGALSVNTANMILDSSGTLKLGNNAASNPIFDFSNGSLSLTGSVTATSFTANGTLGSFIVNSSSLGFYKNNNGLFVINADGSISCSSSLIISAGGVLDIQSANFRLQSDDAILQLRNPRNNDLLFDFSNGSLSIMGDINATNITANTGTIAGWYITPNGF